MKNEEPSFEDLLELAKQADARNNNHRRKRDLQKLARRKLAPAPTQADLVKLGGRPDGETVIFGGEGHTTLVFKPSRIPQSHGWTVELTGRTSREERKRVLSASGRGLWDRQADAPDSACEAAAGLIDCVRDFSAKVSSKERALAARHCLLALHEALRAGKGKKLQIAFDLLSSEAAWAGTDKVDALQEQCLLLATEKQRPPSKKELKDRFERKGNLIDKSSFAELLRHAGLGWLRQEGRAAD